MAPDRGDELLPRRARAVARWTRTRRRHRDGRRLRGDPPGRDPRLARDADGGRRDLAAHRTRRHAHRRASSEEGSRWGALPRRTRVAKGDALFPRIDERGRERLDRRPLPPPGPLRSRRRDERPLERRRAGHALAAGVDRVVIIGTDAETSRQALEITGLERPSRSTRPSGCTPTKRSRTSRRSPSSPGAAIDAWWASASAASTTSTSIRRASASVEAFAAQIALAHELDLALVIHARDAFDDLLDVLRGEGSPPRTVVHCFTGTPEDAENASRRAVTSRCRASSPSRTPSPCARRCAGSRSSGSTSRPTARSWRRCRTGAGQRAGLRGRGRRVRGRTARRGLRERARGDVAPTRRVCSDCPAR